RAHEAADEFEKGRALQRFRRAPTVDGERQGTPDARIVEGRFMGVEDNKQIGEPRTFAHIESLAQGLHELITLRRRDTAEFRHEGTTLVSLHHRGAAYEVGSISVQVGPVGEKILVPALPGPMIAFHMLDEDEGTGAENMRFGELLILVELGGAVDAIPGRREI